jgi:5-methylcytosine-specific restriction endonuclease McrA
MAKHYNRANRRDLIYNKYNGHCAYCGCEISFDNFSVDHIEPVFRGHTNDQITSFGRTRGVDSLDNYNPCCKSCNSSKATFTLEKWRSEISKKFDRCARDCSSYSMLLRFGLIEEKRNSVLFYFEKINTNG